MTVMQVHLLDVPGQPHSGEVAPAQFTDHMVSSIEKIPDLHMMISTCPRKDRITLTHKPTNGCCNVGVRQEKERLYPCSSHWGLPVHHHQSPGSLPPALEEKNPPGLNEIHLLDHVALAF